MPTPHIYLAPMEGVTTFLYRRAHAAVYGPLDKYFTPFLEPREKRSMKTKEASPWSRQIVLGNLYAANALRFYFSPHSSLQMGLYIRKLAPPSRKPDIMPPAGGFFF